MYTARRALKRGRRQLWIARINAAVRRNGQANYSTFMHTLASSACRLNRKSLAQLAALEPVLFTQLISQIYG